MIKLIEQSWLCATIALVASIALLAYEIYYLYIRKKK